RKGDRSAAAPGGEQRSASARASAGGVRALGPLRVRLKSEDSWFDAPRGEFYVWRAVHCQRRASQATTNGWSRRLWRRHWSRWSSFHRNTSRDPIWTISGNFWLQV